MSNLRQSMSQEEWDNMGKVINTPKTPTPPSPQKFCFRYDGSDDSNKAIGLINNKFARGYSGIVDRLYDSDGFYWEPREQQSDMTLVTPSEFIRLMKGEEWMPKYGEEVIALVDTIEQKRIYIATDPQRPELHITKDPIGLTLGYSKHIAPIRKSLREDVSDVLYQSLRDSGLEKNLYKAEYPDQSVYPDLITTADRIIQLIKERGVEG